LQKQLQNGVGGAIGNTTNSNRYFLPDVKELDAQLLHATAIRPLSKQVISSAQSKLFSFTKSVQPTLTQMFGDGDNAAASGSVDDGAKKTTIKSSSSSAFAGQLPTIAEGADTEQTPDTQELENKQVIDDDDDFLSDNEKEEEDAIVVHRVEWKDGMEHTTSQGVSLWSSLLMGQGHYGAAWDRLFDEPSQQENVDMNELLGMLDGLDQSQRSDKSEAPVENDGDENATSSLESPTLLSMLSQGGRVLAEDLIQSVADDSDRLQAIQAACPDWRENVIFALHQKDFENVGEAMARVQEQRSKLQRAKEMILKAAEQHDAALQVFEQALAQSFHRRQPTDQQQQSLEGFMPSQVMRASPRGGRKEDVQESLLLSAPIGYLGAAWSIPTLPLASSTLTQIPHGEQHVESGIRSSSPSSANCTTSSVAFQPPTLPVSSPQGTPSRLERSLPMSSVTSSAKKTAPQPPSSSRRSEESAAASTNTPVSCTKALVPST
jgi:hypothetical protein